jgi:thiamine biosynthesis protein ThiC
MRPPKSPCVQTQLKCLTLAQQAAELAWTHKKANRSKKKLAQMREMDRWYRIYQQAGGRLPLIYVEKKPSGQKLSQ